MRSILYLIPGCSEYSFLKYLKTCQTKDYIYLELRCIRMKCPTKDERCVSIEKQLNLQKNMSTEEGIRIEIIETMYGKFPVIHDKFEERFKPHILLWKFTSNIWIGSSFRDKMWVARKSSTKWKESESSWTQGENNCWWR